MGGFTVSVNAGMLITDRPGAARWMEVDSSSIHVLSQTMVTVTQSSPTEVSEDLPTRALYLSSCQGH